MHKQLDLKIIPVFYPCNYQEAKHQILQLFWFPPLFLGQPINSYVLTYRLPEPTIHRKIKDKYKRYLDFNCIATALSAIWYFYYSLFTMSITIFLQVWRCFLERLAKISHSGFWRSLKATAKWWFSNTDSSLYMRANSEPIIKVIKYSLNEKQIIAFLYIYSISGPIFSMAY